MSYQFTREDYNNQQKTLPDAGKNSFQMPKLTASSVQSFMDLIKPDIDYDILNMTADFQELQADQMQLQVEQEANRLREEFAQGVGSAVSNAARRGVKVGEGSIQQNIEMSAMDVGKDIQTAKGNVDYKSAIIRKRAKSLRKSANASRDINLMNKVTDFGSQKGRK